MSEFTEITAMDTDHVMKLKELVDAESDRLQHKMDMMYGVRLMITEWLEMTIKTDHQQVEIGDLRQQLADERRQREELEMKLAEMSKLSASMAKKASEEAMLKALRTYANTSKHKKIDKKVFAKTAILEMAMLNGLTLPPDLAATIDALDDDEPEPKTVVQGDLIMNKHVGNEVNNVAAGGVGIKTK